MRIFKFGKVGRIGVLGFLVIVCATTIYMNKTETDSGVTIVRQSTTNDETTIGSDQAEVPVIEETTHKETTAENSLNISDTWFYHFGEKTYMTNSDNKILDISVETWGKVLTGQPYSECQKNIEEQKIQSLYHCETCIEWTIQNPMPLTFTSDSGESVVEADYDKLLVCLTQDETTLFVSKEGVYQTSYKGVVNKAQLEALKVNNLVSQLFEMVNYSDGQVEICQEKVIYHATDISELLQMFSSQQMDQAMYRAVVGYKAIYDRNTRVLEQIATQSVCEQAKSMTLPVAMPSEIVTPRISKDAPQCLLIKLIVNETKSVEFQVCFDETGTAVIEGLKE